MQNARSSWIEDPDRHTLPALLDRRLADDPDGEYLDVCGTKLTASSVATTAASLAGALRSAGRASGRPGRHPARELARGAAGLVGHRAGGRRRRCPINTAYKGEYLRHQLADSGSRVLVVEAALADRAAAVVAAAPERWTTSWSWADDDTAMPGRPTHRWADLLGCRPHGRRSVDVPPVGPGHVHLHRRHDRARPRAACSATTTTPPSPARSASAGSARADDVVWTPLPLFHFNAITTAVVGPCSCGRPGGHLPALLGLELLAGDEPDRRHDHLHARHHGLPAGPRRRPTRDAAVGRARGQRPRCA